MNKWTFICDSLVFGFSLFITFLAGIPILAKAHCCLPATLNINIKGPLFCLMLLFAPITLHIYTLTHSHTGIGNAYTHSHTYIYIHTYIHLQIASFFQFLSFSNYFLLESYSHNTVCKILSYAALLSRCYIFLHDI